MAIAWEEILGTERIWRVRRKENASLRPIFPEIQEISFLPQKEFPEPIRRKANVLEIVTVLLES